MLRALCLWILLCYRFYCALGGRWERPSPAPGFLIDNPKWVVLDVKQTLTVASGTVVTDEAKKVFATAVENSLVCCTEYHVEIHGIKPLGVSSRRRLRGHRDLSRRQLDDGTPKEQIRLDYFLYFENEKSYVVPKDSNYPDQATVEFLSATASEFDYIMKILNETVVEGGFSHKLVSSNAEQNCPVFNEFEVGALDIDGGTNPYKILEEEAQHEMESDSKNHRHIALSLGLLFLIICCITGLFYVQYCWGFLPCYDKWFKQKWKDLYGRTLFGEDYDDEWLEDDGEAEDVEAARKFEEYLSSIRIRDNDDITPLADPEVRFGRGHIDRRKSLIKVEPLHLEGFIPAIIDGGVELKEVKPPQPRSLSGLFGSFDGDTPISSPLHGIGEEDEDEEDDDDDDEEDESGSKKKRISSRDRGGKVESPAAAEDVNAALGMGASSIESFFDNLPDSFAARESTSVERMSMAKVIASYNSEHTEELSASNLASKVRNASMTVGQGQGYGGGGAAGLDRGSTLDNFVNTSRPTRRSDSASDSDDMKGPLRTPPGSTLSASSASIGKNSSDGSMSGSGGERRRPSDGSDEQKDAYVKYSTSPDVTPKIESLGMKGGLKLSPAEMRRPSLRGVVKRKSDPPVGVGLLEGEDNTVSLESNPVVRASKFPSRRRMSSFRGSIAGKSPGT